MCPVGKNILILNNNKMLPCVSRFVAFTIKNIGIIILFSCLVGWLDSSPIETKKNEAKSLKKTALAWAGTTRIAGLGLA